MMSLDTLSSTLNSRERAPAHYFPVSPKPLVMEAGFSPLSADFGNGARDQLYFQRDREWRRYRETKVAVEPERHWAVSRAPEHLELHLKALRWLTETQAHELGESPSAEVSALIEGLAGGQTPPHQALSSAYHELSLHAQEDLALLAERPTSSLVMGEISMPSHWAPQRIKEVSFWEIHTPVPGFPRDERVSERLGKMIAERGPLVRFVWTVATDDQLDHHPKHRRTPWEEASALWFRVERQLTVPLEGLGALFLIRTYLYPLTALSAEERSTLREALTQMPEEVARYKGLWSGRGRLLEALV